MTQNNSLLEWAKKLKAISQAGHTYSKDKYDLERFGQIQQIAFEMLSEISGEPIEKISNLYIPETGYPTPKVDVRAGVIRDNKILLVREREDGCWTLPGGWGDVCETPTQGVIREVLEESGFIVNNPKLIAVKDRDVHPYSPKFPFHIYKMIFLCELVSGSPTPNIEISEIEFFAQDDLPPLSQSRTLPEDIQLIFEHHKDQDLGVYVD